MLFSNKLFKHDKKKKTLKIKFQELKKNYYKLKNKLIIKIMFKYHSQIARYLIKDFLGGPKLIKQSHLVNL